MGNKKKASTDEYQFPNDEYVVADASSEPHAKVEENFDDLASEYAQTSNLGFMRNKRILGAVAVAVVALVVFILFSGNKTKVISQQPEAAPVSQVAAPSPELVGQMSGLQQQVEANASAVNNMKAQVQDLQTQLQTSNNANQQLANAVRDLATQMQTMNAAVDKLTHPPVKKVVKKVVPVRPIHYFLKAVVPGRAWIQNSDGVAQTIRVGDNLPQYGVVISVDAEQGMVLTSSGKVIGYGENDS